MSTTTAGAPAADSVTMEVEEGIAVIRLDQPDRAVNVISRTLMGELDAMIARLEAGEARAAMILSGKPGVWIAGADIEEFKEFGTAAQAEGASRAAHALLDRLEKLPIPVVAAIDGVALGGGLELALACTYRIATDSPRTRLGLPEVQLGILPGAGGTQRLPRLIGLAASLDLMLTGKQLDARRARSAGLLDEVVPQPILQRTARDRAADLASGALEPRVARPRGSPRWMENLPGARALIMRKARATVLAKTHGLYPAPLKILEVVRGGLDRPLTAALRLEAEAFGELAVTPEARALTHVFFATTAAKSEPALPADATARDVDRIAIVGAGFMGAGIATIAAEAGLRVRLKDVSDEAAAKGLATAAASIRKRAARRRRAPHEVTAVLDRVEATSAYTGFGTVDLVVEAVYEDVELKHRVFRDIEAALPAGAVLGSNTSTIPINRLAQGADRPESLIGLHFFSPVEKMPLLEIIMGDATDPNIAATSHRWGKRIGKTPIVVRDGPGFYVNRILAPYMNEAAALLREGLAIEEIDAAMVGWGFPVGPITLFDEVGLDVAAKSGRILAEAFPDRVQPNDVVDRLVADGRLGRKNGRGFYQYEKGKKGKPDESVYRIVGAGPRTEVPADELHDRLVLPLINEAVRCLEDGVLQNARDGDVGAIMGFGFPPFRGGVFWYLDREGPAAVLQRLRRLQSRFGDRFAPAPLLVRAAESGHPFTAS
jgi:3-hydroxyacyl-CoA dehydrogenase/enoyl-CoA hydratase/3-hydroxybutyryl-CoA epimerase